MPRRPAARAGMALILTLAAIVLAGGLALYLQTRAAAAAELERGELRRERLRLAAAEAAREALWILAADEDLQLDHLGEEWAAPRETVHEDGVATRAMVEDAARFFNWNNLAPTNRGGPPAREVLFDLMTFCDADPVVRVDALGDFVDADEEGAYEAESYRTDEAPFRPPNRELWAPAELLRVKGFSADLFRSPSGSGPAKAFGGDLAASTALVPVPLKEPIRVNVCTANREVLLAVVGLQYEAEVGRLLTWRQAQPAEALSVIPPELAAALAGTVATASRYFRVRASARLENQSSSVMAWVERDDRSGDIRILQWVEEG